MAIIISISISILILATIFIFLYFKYIKKAKEILDVTKFNKSIIDAVYINYNEYLKQNGLIPSETNFNKFILQVSAQCLDAFDNNQDGGIRWFGNSELSKYGPEPQPEIDTDNLFEAIDTAKPEIIEEDKIDLTDPTVILNIPQVGDVIDIDNLTNKKSKSKTNELNIKKRPGRKKKA